MDDDFDFDRAASAFPAISLDGAGDLPSFSAVPAPAPGPPSAFSFDDFGSPPRQTFNEVKVTGDDEIEKFEDQFPELDVGHVRLVSDRTPCGVRVGRPWGADVRDVYRPCRRLCLRSLRLGLPLRSLRVLSLPRSPRRLFLTNRSRKMSPKSSGTSGGVTSPSAFHVYTHALNHALWDREWREKQAEEIKQRDEASKAKREETVSKAEAAIDQFYEEYAARKERSIRENKHVHFLSSCCMDRS